MKKRRNKPPYGITLDINYIKELEAKGDADNRAVNNYTEAGREFCIAIRHIVDSTKDYKELKRELLYFCKDREKFAEYSIQAFDAAIEAKRQAQENKNSPS